MKKTIMLFAEGFEEVEALTVVDLLRRAEIGCDMAALAETDTVTGSHGIGVRMDTTLSRAELADYDGILLPGGMPGTRHLGDDRRVIDALRAAHAAGKLTAASVPRRLCLPRRAFWRGDARCAIRVWRRSSPAERAETAQLRSTGQ